MFNSIGDLLKEDLPSVSFFKMPGKDPKISKKDWVQKFPEVKAGFRNATLNCIEERPGQKYGHLQNLAKDRIKRFTSNTNVFYKLIEQKADVTRNFQKYLSFPYRPPGATTNSKTIDHYFSLMVESYKYCLCDEWSGAKIMGTVTKRLGQKMRGLVNIYYDCGAVSVINRFALDILIRCGWMRVVGQLSRRSNIQIGEWMQKFEYWSGRPRWRHCNLNSIRLSHPDGYRRKYDVGAGRWYWHTNGQFVSWSNPQLRSST
ncbi:hypothetical protein M9X92_011797 [Pyricularia oryzae]|nr:hypothetical protein M9X92_011797 [Pyricularia oryzae]